MIPSYLYWLAGLSLLIAAAVLSTSAAGRRFLLASLPAFAFFTLLAFAGFVGYRIGLERPADGARDKPVPLYTCSMHPQIREPAPGLCPICHMELVLLAAAAPGDGNTVTIDPVVVQNMGVRVHVVERGPLHRSLRAFGALEAAQSRQHAVALKVAGFVEKLHAHTEGMAIRAGDPLFELYAPELVIAQEELIAARKSGDPALLAAAREKLLLWDVPAATVDELQARDSAQRTLVWRSPVDGVLLQRATTAGAPAPRDEVLLRITDLSVLWLDVQLPEQHLAAVHSGQPATASLAALPGTVLEAQVAAILPTIDPQTRTGTVRVEVANPDGALKPGMFARVELHAELAADAVLLPREAVLDTGVRQVAWLALGAGEFAPRDLRLGHSGDGGVVQVLDGLAPGDRVVVSGQLLIDAESSLREGSRKLSHHGVVADGDPLPPREKVALTSDQQQQIDALLRAYLRVVEAFAADRDDAAAWDELRAAAAAAPDAMPPELRADAAALAEALAAGPADLESRRNAMRSASQAAIALFERARPSPTFGAELFVIHCPMVVADWLQTDATVRNPYDATMPRCGEVKARLTLQPGEPR